MEKNVSSSFLRHLLRSIAETWKGFMSLNVEVALHKNPISPNEIDCLSRVEFQSSHHQGVMCLGAGRPAMLEFLKIMFGEVPAELPKGNDCPSGELLNMIYCAVRKPVNEEGSDFKMAIPKILTGTEFEEARHGLSKAEHCFVCRTDVGSFFVTLSLRPANEIKKTA